MSRSRTLWDRHGKLAEYIDDELVWARDDACGAASDNGPQVVRDIEPYRSMIDGSVIDGRKRHRDHLRAHGCIEVGNEQPKPRKPVITGPSMKESLHRVLADVGDRDLRRMIKEEIRRR